MGRETIQILNVDVVNASLIFTGVLFYELVLLLILVFLFTKAVVVELLLVHVVDEVDVVFDFFFVAHSHCLVFVGFKVCGGEDLVVLMQLLTKYFIAVNKVFTDPVSNAVLSLDSFLKKVFKTMVVVRYVRVELDGIRVGVLTVFVEFNLTKVGQNTLCAICGRHRVILDL
jgi:hypothetical protein